MRGSAAISVTSVPSQSFFFRSPKHVELPVARPVQSLPERARRAIPLRDLPLVAAIPVSHRRLLGVAAAAVLPAYSPVAPGPLAAPAVSVDRSVARKSSEVHKLLAPGICPLLSPRRPVSVPWPEASRPDSSRTPAPRDDDHACSHPPNMPPPSVVDALRKGA